MLKSDWISLKGKNNTCLHISKKVQRPNISITQILSKYRNAKLTGALAKKH